MSNARIPEVSSRFRVKQLPKGDESLSGYLRRFADANGYLAVESLLAVVGMRYGRQLVERGGELSRRLGLPEDAVLGILPSAQPRAAALDWRFERHHRDPVCPVCLEEGRHYRQSWRHALVSACPLHEVRLVDSCPRCGTELRPGRGGLGTCKCSFRLEQSRRTTPEKVELIVAGLIDARPGSMATPFPGLGGDVPPSIGRFLVGLSHDPLASRTGKSGKTPLPRTASETAGYLAALGTIFSRWPEGLHHEVRARLERAGPDARSAPETLGGWYQHIMRTRQEPFYEPFRRELASAIASHFAGPYTGFQVGSADRVFASVTHAARLLHVRAERIVTAVAAGQIAGQISEAGVGHRHTVVPLEAIEDVKKARERFVNAKTAKAYLGVGTAQFSLLLEAGVIPLAPEDACPILADGGIDLHGLVAWVASLREAAKAPPGASDLVAFKNLTLRRTTDREALLSLYKAISSGALPAAVPDPSGRLGDFTYPVSEVDSFLRNKRHSRSMTAHEVAQATGWKHQVVVEWCRLGLLQAMPIAHGRGTGWQIAVADLARFQETFIPVATLARQKDTSAKALIAKLQAVEVETVGAVAEGSTTRGHLVRIADLAGLF